MHTLLSRVRRCLTMLFGRALAPAATTAFCLATMHSASAATFNIANGDVAGLFAAINTANSNGQADVINLASNGTYTINTPDSFNTGLPELHSEIVINGNNAVIERPAGAGSFRIMSVNNGNVTLNDLALRGGSPGSYDGAAIFIGGAPGGATVTINRCRFVNSVTSGFGGGMCATASTNSGLTLNINDCVFDSNTSYSGGGGLACFTPVTLTIRRSSLIQNYGQPGGGMYFSGVTGTPTLESCTISGNSAPIGGGLYSASGAVLDIRGCTITNNSASGDGGGIYAVLVSGNGVPRVGHSIVWGNSCTPNPSTRDISVPGGTLRSSGYNFIGVPGFTQITCSGVVGACSTDRIGVDPLIAPLSTTGGAMPAHIPLCGSPLIDAGDPAGGNTTNDQWGRVRGVDGDWNRLSGVDIGAVEVVPSTCTRMSAPFVGWGFNGFGQTAAPAPNDAFVSVAAGFNHTLALRSGGVVAAFGRSIEGQLNVPAPNSGFVEVAAGFSFSLGLRADGSIAAWGDNSAGQLTLPSPNSGFIAIAAGDYHALALRQDGSVVCWGRSVSGQLNVPAPNSGFVAISGGSSHSMGLKQDGSIVCWGRSTEGQLTAPTPNSGFRAITARGNHSHGLKIDGSILGWGENPFGVNVVPGANTGFAAFSAGGENMIALKGDGSVVAWGRTDLGAASVPSPNTGYIAVSMGGAHAATLRRTSGACCTGTNCTVVVPELCTAPGAYKGDNTTCVDSDGDGVANVCDGCPNDRNKIAPGACGCGNPETDSDGDGVPDCIDGCPNDPNKTSPGACGCGRPEMDSDGDGVPDCLDGCPNDRNKTTPGACGCGHPDTDTDGDGVPDCLDGCPNDPNKTSPGTCGCGTPDTDTDGDGVPDCMDGCPNDRNKTSPGACGCGRPEMDSDGDGVPDCLDGCPNDRNKTSPGTCGCGTPDTDTDGDGVPDCLDGCPNDPGKTSPGACGCGVPETDRDGDGIPDCIDQCPIANDTIDCDGDGVPDGCQLAAPPGLASAVSFDGVDDGINCGTVNIGPRFTIMAWVKPTSVAGMRRIVSSRSCPGGISLAITDGKLRLSGFGAFDLVTSGTYIIANRWQHVAVVFDSNFDASFYVNGTLKEVVQWVGGFTPSSGPMYIGRSPCSSADAFAGQIRELQIINDVSDRNTLIFMMTFQPLFGFSNYAGYWRLDQASGNSVVEYTTFTLSGTLLNGAAMGPVTVEGDCNRNGVPDSCELAPVPSGKWALDFDGVDDRVIAGNVPLTAPFTIEAWVNPDSITGLRRIVSNRACPGGVSFASDNGNLILSLFSLGTYTTTNTYLAPGVWAHVAVTMAANHNVTFYVNGRQAQFFAGTSAPFAGGSMWIGANPCSSPETWDGKIAEVRVWSVAKTASDLVSTAHTALEAGTPGLAGCWRFEEGYGTTTADASGNGFAGSILNGPAYVLTLFDCNSNGVLDGCELDSDHDGIIDACDNCPTRANTDQTDSNHNGIGDLCDCPADFNHSGILSVQDIFDFLAAYFSADPRADFNNSGITSVQDIFDFLAPYFAGCP